MIRLGRGMVRLEFSRWGITNDSNLIAVIKHDQVIDVYTLLVDDKDAVDELHEYYREAHGGQAPEIHVFRREP